MFDLRASLYGHIVRLGQIRRPENKKGAAQRQPLKRVVSANLVQEVVDVTLEHF